MNNENLAMLQARPDIFNCSETSMKRAALGTPVQNVPRQEETHKAIESLWRELLVPVETKFGAIKVTYGFAGHELVNAVRRRAREEGRLPKVTPARDPARRPRAQHAGQADMRQGGQAVDFYVTGQSSLEVADWIAANLRFDRMYLYSATQPFHLSWSANPVGQIVKMIPKAGGGLRPHVVRRESPIAQGD